MAVTEAIQALGGWSVALRPDTPRVLLDKMKYFGHIAINTGKVNPMLLGDGLLNSSQYVGVLRRKAGDPDQGYNLNGPGMAMWLGDEDKKGDVLEAVKTINNLTFQDTIRQLLPSNGSVIEGTLFDIGQNFTGTFQYVSPREAINYVADTLDAYWIVRGDGTIDAGLETDLFRTNPIAIVARKDHGTDMFARSFAGSLQTEQDVEDFTTRVVLLAQDDTGGTVTATADIDPAKNPYKDIHGNIAKLTRLIGESETDDTNAQARAQLQLNRFSGTRDAIRLSSQEYDINGTVGIGDSLWVYDPDLSISDSNNEVIFRGKRISPMKLKLYEMTWPVTQEMSVAYRDWDGSWVDLTPYVAFEQGDTTLVVGGYNRALIQQADGAQGGAGGAQPGPNLTIPDQVVWDTPFLLSTYQNDDGDTRAQVELKWTKPLNTDLTNIDDGSHYEIRWRSASHPIYPVTWAQLAGYTWGELKTNGATWGNPIVYDTGRWEHMFVAWDELTFVVQDLMPSKPYEAQIRAVDGAVPANYGAWSLITQWQTTRDTIPPSTPAPPLVVASRIAVQVTHQLGRAEGGTYNLDADIHHFDVHGSIDEHFAPTSETLLGKISASNAMIRGKIPAVGTIPIENVVPVWFRVIAVDKDGNASNPSTAVQQTAQLIDDAHISDLTVSKITAGTITTDWILAGTIKTADTGARVVMESGGVKAYNSSGTLTSEIRSSDGTMKTVGEVSSGLTGKRIVLNELVGGTYIPEMRFYPGTGSTYSYINAPEAAGIATIGMNSGQEASRQTTMWLFSNTATLAWTEFGTATPKGGKMQVGDTYAQIGYDDSFNPEGFVKVNNLRQIEFKGYAHNGNPSGDQPGIWYQGITFDGGSVSFGPGPTTFGRVFMTPGFSCIGGYDAAISVMGFNISNASQSVGTGVGGVNGRYGCVMFRLRESA